MRNMAKSPEGRIWFRVQRSTHVAIVYFCWCAFFLLIRAALPIPEVKLKSPTIFLFWLMYALSALAWLAYQSPTGYICTS